MGCAAHSREKILSKSLSASKRHPMARVSCSFDLFPRMQTTQRLQFFMEDYGSHL